MGLVASLVIPSACSLEERERLACIALRATEALRIPRTTPPSTKLSKHARSYDLGPYSWLHKLRRAALVAAANQYERFQRRLKPESEDRDPLVRASRKDWQHAELTEHVLQRMPSGEPNLTAILNATVHLVHHEDHAGFYLPFDFPQPLWVRDPSPTAEHEYTSVGSSVALVRELNAVCAALQLPDGMSFDDVQLIQSLDTPTPVGLPWQTNPEAAFVAMRLKHLATESVEKHLAIAFS